MDVPRSATRSALSTLVAVIVAPSDAFAAIRERPVWVWALLATMVFGAIGAILGTPVSRHIIEVSLPGQLANDPRFAGLSAEAAHERIQQMVALTLTWVNFSWLFVLALAPLATLFEGGIAYGVRALARGRGTFKQIFTLAAHVQFIGLGLSALGSGAIVSLRPLDSFRTQIDYFTAVPSLAWIVPGAPLKVTAFLAALQPFSIWSTVILACGLVEIAALKRPVAWTTSIAILLASAAWAAAFIR